jgi:hypothetical protein
VTVAWEIDMSVALMKRKVVSVELWRFLVWKFAGWYCFPVLLSVDILTNDIGHGGNENMSWLWVNGDKYGAHGRKSP